ncbi:uncharacterized protein LOC143286837 [Babylonia areolata]|uniref:uncharacterized protein LOC143286837 n=1 Tax=Babylonia areolata TaxID=304850 RepID=UPI003FD1726D
MDEDSTPTRVAYEDLTPSRMRNPSPPPELLTEEANADFIKGTGYSKIWVYSVLLNLMQEVERHVSLEAEPEENESGIVEVSESQQNELCILWDITMNEDVARFLMDPEYNTVKILTFAIYKSRAPRINELCIGMLGNICTDRQCCVTVSENEDLVKLTCAILSNIEFDAPTLKETIRLIVTCLGVPEVRPTWLQAILDTPDVISLLLFVLESSVDVSLLKLTGSFLDEVMMRVDEVCEAWASPQLVANILVALKQIGYKTKEDVKPFLSVFQLLSTTQPGVQSLVEHSERVMRILVYWLREVCDTEILVVDDHLPHHTYVVSVLSLLLTTVGSVTDYILTRPALLKDMLTTLSSLYIVRKSSPYKLPHCIFFTPRLISLGPESTEQGVDPGTVSTQNSASASSVTDTGNSQGEVSSSAVKSGNPDQQTVGTWEEGEEEREQDRERSRYEASLRYKALLESLQDYFHNFFSAMKLDDDSSEEESEKKGKRIEFYKSLKYFEKHYHNQYTFGHVVSCLVYNIPEVTDKSGVEEQLSISDEGWKIAEHVAELCHRQYMHHSHERFKEAIGFVRSTAGKNKDKS